MSRIEAMNDEIQWTQTPQSSSKGHKDYEANLKHAESFCKNVQKSLLRGMNVKIADGEHIKKALLIISWKPGFHEKKGNYATPVSLHQYNEDFKKTAQNVLNSYMKAVGDHQAKNPEQPDFFKESYVKV